MQSYTEKKLTTDEMRSLTRTESKASIEKTFDHELKRIKKATLDLDIAEMYT